MRKLNFLILAGLLLAILNTDAIADGLPRKRKTKVSKLAKASQNSELVELLRQTRDAAEAARDEASRARRQSEALQQQLDHTARELAALRQTVSQTSAEYGQRIAELKADLGKLQSSSLVASTSPPSEAAETSPSEERLTKLEEEIEVNTAQIREHAQTKVETDSRFRVRLSGMLLVNTFLNSDDSSFNDLPTFAFPASARAGQRRNNLGATMRQTRIGFALTGPRIGNVRLSAEAEFDFWGGSFNREEGDILGTFRIRTASARLDWDRGAIEVGQVAPLVSPLSPDSLATVWFPAMTGAGNLWQWRPQIIGERRARLGDGAELVFQAGIMPTFGELVRNVIAEGPPAYEGRVAFRRALGGDRQLELGLGGHFGQKDFSANRSNQKIDRKVDGYILAGDWRIPLGARVEVSGEAYHGRAVTLGEWSGGRADRAFAITGSLDDVNTRVRGVRSSGGWIQLSLQARPDLDFNLAYGQEDSNNDDIRTGAINDFTRFKNQTGSANFIYRLRPNFLISLEYRRLLTDYATGRRKNNHYNLAFGYLF